MKVVTVVGARPQFIKAALVSAELKSNGVEEILVHTGQHYDDNMSDIFFRQMGITEPAYNLSIQSSFHGEMTGRMLTGVEQILIKEQPDWLLVYGDTNSTLAGALAARKLNIPIAHVEAGLRNFDFTIPEDVNRTLTDRISTILFCPTEKSIDNLEKEGFRSFPCKIIKTDDLLSDTVSIFTAAIKATPELVDPSIRNGIKDYILCTVHRQDSTLPAIFPQILNMLNLVADDKDIIFPIHPRTRKVLENSGLRFNKNVHLIDPVGYMDMQYLLSNASYVITDSGGLQKEAYLHGKYSLLLMDYTPWEELVQQNVSVTTELSFDAMVANYQSMKKLTGLFDQFLYGHGNARKQIVAGLLGQ